MIAVSIAPSRADQPHTLGRPLPHQAGGCCPGLPALRLRNLAVTLLVWWLGMSDQRILGLSGLFGGRLPINRKERYYTGTVLPMIVASNGFKHFGQFLALCGVPEVALEADPASSNVQFFTEYGFKESLVDGAEKRFRDPGGRDTPDLVVYVESEPSLLLGVEAKVFHRPSVADLREQLRKQADLLSVMAAGAGTRPSTHQVALLPAGLRMPQQIDETSVLTWELVADTFRYIAPPYWIGVLDEALRRYNRLASQGSGDTYGQNCDAKMLGQEIYQRYKAGDNTYTWMGRNRGLYGLEVQRDVESGEWRRQRYEVRYEPLAARNWFPIADFIRLVEKPQPDKAAGSRQSTSAFQQQQVPRSARNTQKQRPTGFETFGQNCDAKILGQEIWDCYESNDTTYTWMGRNRGLHGQELQKDVETEKWRTQRYEVRHNPLPGNRNWFPIDAFIKKIKFYRRIKETSR